MTYTIPKIQGERLLSALKNKGLNEYGGQKWLSEQLGISVQSVNKWIKNRQRINEKHVPKLKKVLGVDDDYFVFLAHPGVLPSHLNYGVSVPVLDWTIDSTLEKAKNNSAITRVLCEKSLTDKCFALQVNDDSMSRPEKGISFPADTYIVVDPDKAATDGDFVVAYKKGSKTRTFKQFHTDGENSFLTSLNPIYGTMPVDDSVKIIGVVIHSQLTLK